MPTPLPAREVELPLVPPKDHRISRKGVPDGGCLGCGEAHWLADCTTTPPQEAKKLYDDFTTKKRISRSQVRSLRTADTAMRLGRDQDDARIVFSGAPDYPLCYDLDDGASATYMSENMFQELVAHSKISFQAEDLDTPVKVVQAASNDTMTVIKSFVTVFSIYTTGGWLQFPKGRVYVTKEPMDCILVGRPALKSVGVDIVAGRKTGPGSTSGLDRHAARTRK